MRQMSLMLLVALWGSFCADLSADQAADQADADDAAIRKTVEDYVVAFNRGDAQAVAALWSPEAVYTDAETGELFRGRQAIEQHFAEVFAASKGVRLAASTKEVQFISPGVAVEFGAAKVMRSDQEAEETEYTAVYVKRDGAWLLDRVTEDDVPVVRSNYQHLQELEWMIGSWVDRDEEATIETQCQWTKNRNFMTRMFAVTVRDRIEVSGMQLVGWDPAAKQIRSWVFDSDGGFGEGTWTKKGDSWCIQVRGTAPDGSKSSSVNIITPVDNDTFTWQSVSRFAGGGLLPNVDEVMVVRQTDAD